MRVRRAAEADMDVWLAMRRALWPATDAHTLAREARAILDDERQAAFLAVNEQDCVVGFAEYSIHPHAMGCTSSPVGYLEGWWIEPALRRRGFGAELVRVGEAWVREQGCRELASDTWLGNEVSDRAHAALGFVEAGRLIHYRKAL